MKVPVSWLQEYVSPLPPADELAERLTMLGLEVDAVVRTGAGLEKVLVGKVLEVNQHPNADRLTYCKVTIGSQPLDIVCGATNHKAGDYVAVALPGTTLPNGIKLKKSKIRGVESMGMMCSEQELGLGDSHDGIIVMEGEPKVGSSFAEAFDLLDDVIDIDLTPNRGDCLSMLGVAREVAADRGLTVKRPQVEIGPEGGGFDVSNEAPDQCPRYTGILIEGIKIGPSPAWLARKLERAGLRSINNVVDATNFVMLEYGQPPHAFDADTLRGDKIIVRMAKPGETIKVIDGTVIKLTPEDMVIADGERPVALAGVMGGLETEVSDKTTRVLLEMAFFTAIPLRRKSKRHGMSSDASQRFERGVDFEAIVESSWRCARLIEELSGGRIKGGITIADGPAETLQLYQRRNVSIRPSRAEHLLGVPIAPSMVRDKLTALGLKCLEESDDSLQFEVPSHRNDLEREVDLIEEVARTVGYNEFPNCIYPVPFTGESRGVQRTERIEQIRRFLEARGWREAVTYSFVAKESLKGWSDLKPPKIANPLSLQQEVMRTSVVPSLLTALKKNYRRGVTEVALFEVARVYGGDHGLLEPGRLSGVLTAPREPGWRGKAPNAKDAASGNRDIFDVKGDLVSLLSSLGIQDAIWERTQKPSTLHPGFASRILLNEIDLGYLGVLHPDVVDEMELTIAPVVFELDLDAILQAMDRKKPELKMPSEFPSVTRDLALIVPANVEAHVVEDVIVQEAGQWLESCRLFDVYRGDQTGGEVSLAFRYTLRSAKDTLKEKAVEKTEERILAKLQREYGITRRQ